MPGFLDYLNQIAGAPNEYGHEQMQDDLANAGEDIVVTGDAWKPRKQTLLGAIADGYLMSKGKKPMFQVMRDRRNVNEAMDGFVNDPQRAMRRLSQIPGQEGTALEMYQKYRDDERADGQLDRQNRLFDYKLEEAVRDRVAGAMGVATPDNWPIMRERMLKYGLNKGVDLSGEIPEVYNPDIVNMIRYGEIPVAKQEQLQQGERRLDQGDTRLQQGERRLDQGDVRLQQQGAATESLIEHRNESRAERARHNRVSEGQGQQRINQAGKKTAGAKTVKTRLGDGELSPDGTKLRVRQGNEYVIYDYDPKTNRGVPIKRTPIK